MIIEVWVKLLQRALVTFSHTPLLCLPQGAQTYSEKPGHRFVLNQSWDAVKAEAYDALVIPGCPPLCSACSLTTVRLRTGAGECHLVCDKFQHWSLWLQFRTCQLRMLSWQPCSAPNGQGRSLQGPRARVPAPGRRGAGPGVTLCRAAGQQADRGHLPRRAAAGRHPGRAQGVRARPPAHAPCWRVRPAP